MFRISEIEIDRSLTLNGLSWPLARKAGSSGEENGFCGNRSYCDLRFLDWPDAELILKEESSYLGRIRAAKKMGEMLEEIEDEILEDPCLMHGMDLGVASSVACLSAMGCIPFASCNGGLLEENHHEIHPLIAFFVRPALLEFLMEQAKVSGCGLEHAEYGSALLYARNIENLVGFARECFQRRML